MTQYFGQFSVADNGRSYEIKGDGARLWDYENHVVTVKGIPDPKAASPVVYVQNVQDSGQPCGNAAAASNNAAQPGAARATGANVGSGAAAATTESSQQPGGGAEQPSSVPSPATPQGTTPQSRTPESGQQGGVSDTAGGSPSTPQAGENKGVPSTGTPQQTVASNMAQQPADDNQVFTGCVLGSINNYQLKSNGKTYSLQGNTGSLTSMVNHQVEITGEDFNGKAIQVNGVRDLGGNCKGK